VRTTRAAGGESSETTVGGTSALLRDLADSTAYTVDVAARNAIGTGPFISAQATTLPPPPPPDTVIMAGPGDGSTIGGRSVTFGFYGVPAAFVASFECELDGGGYEACVSPLVLSDLGEGSHVLRVRAADDAGDADETPAERRFTVDVTAPDTVITSAPADGIATSATFAYAGVPAQDAERFECKLDSGPFMACPASGTSYPYLAPGSHTFSVRALDRASNADQTPASKTWTIRPVSVLTPSPPPAGTSGEVLPVPRSGGREADRRKLVRGLAALPGRARTGKDRRSIAFKLASGAFPAGTRLRFVLAVPAKAIGSPAGRTVTIGSAGATVRARTETTVTIKLTARARAALLRKRRLKARLTATATAPSTAKVTRTTDVVLR
jgi:hypothetical protein